MEIGRARRVSVDLQAIRHISPCADRLLNALRDRDGLVRGIIKAPVAEVIFDQWVLEAGVDVLFHGWVTRLCTSDTRVTGLITATKEGYYELQAPRVIETADAGRLVPRELRCDICTFPALQAVVLCGVNMMAGETLRVDVGQPCPELLVRALGDGQAQLDIPLTLTPNMDRTYQLTSQLPAILGQLRNFAPALAESQLAYIADDLWQAPPFTLASTALTEDANTHIGFLASRNGTGIMLTELYTGCIGSIPHLTGCTLAGPWLPALATCSAHAEVSVLNRILLGEALSRQPGAVNAKDRVG
jgi:hypothetical protein